MPEAKTFASLRCLTETSIAASATTSAAFDLAGTTMAALALPTPFSGTLIEFQADIAGTWQPVHKADGNKLTVTVAGDRVVALNQADFRGLERLRIVSNATEAAIRNISVLSMP